MPGGKQVAGSLAISVHGPAGVLDLLVPSEAVAIDVAREYAEQSRLPSVPALHTSLGMALRPDDALADVGVETGDVLVAAGVPGGPEVAVPLRRARTVAAVAARPGALSVLWFCLATGVAVLAGWLATGATGTLREVTIGLLVGAALVGVLPVGRYAGHRVLAAPAFAGAAALAVAWDPEPERLPTILGVAALVAAVTAAVGRALDQAAEEALKVWIIVGVSVFALSAGCALLGFGPAVVWSVLLVVVTLGARFVPGFAIDVPDNYLIDIERLAVTAWSARERPRGRRGRTIVPEVAVAAVAAKGTRIITAACAAIFVMATVCSPLLLASATLPVDRIGARVQVLFSGAALLLAARSYRHTPARALLRAAGLSCWAWLLALLLTDTGFGRTSGVAVAAILLAVVLVVAAVATGRGWRSAWWSRRAEVAEALAGSGALAAVLVSIGLVRSLWELTLQV